ncbi:aldo/keto reductase [Longirhabdus pacifica]|uniref:aldo/keto reductase n=1 Tax=Longirhabdus pacifica TaxID=2305227 RepID=UPI001008F06D|nr:aldo/keto reductase [Longirhabdus pacifica]
MVKSLADCVTLNNGVQMPWFGLGVFKTKDGHQVIQAVKEAIQVGYRSIDTAAIYQNEQGVGVAVQESEVKREELFITTKVWNSNQGYEETLKAFEESRKKLQLEWIDLYLVHWPVKEKYKETWKALVKLYEEGYVKAIGVSNFQTHHLDDVIQDTGVVPSVNQVEYHPQLQQVELKKYCEKHHIQMEAWSPLMQGKLLDHPTLQKIASKHHKTTAQVILRWDIQQGVITIPKSVKFERIRDNANIFDFSLDEEDVKQIESMNIDKRNGPDPDHFDF